MSNEEKYPEAENELKQLL